MIDASKRSDIRYRHRESKLTTSDTQLQQRLLQLLDERDIRDVLLRYCRGADRCDRELMAGCFHDDALDDHGNWIGIGRDLPDIVADRIQPGAARAMHFVGNVHVDVQGDTAFTESYLLAFRAYERDGRPCTRTRALRFVDRFTRRDGQWRISERVAVDDWNRIDDVDESMPEGAQFRYSRKDRDDPVYAIRRGRVAREPDPRAPR